MITATEPWLGYDEAAEYIGVSGTTLRRWFSEGNKQKIPSYKPGKKRQFRRSELEAWIATRKDA